jgi:ATP-dependent DNA helicase RecQ
MSNTDTSPAREDVRLESRLPEGIRVENLAPPLYDTLTAIAGRRDALAILSPGEQRDMYFLLGAWVIGTSVLVLSPDASRLEDVPHIFIPWTFGEEEPAEIEDAVEEQANGTSQSADIPWPGVVHLPEPESEVIFASPEEIGDSDFREALSELQIGLVVVDAAERVSPHSSEKLVSYSAIPALLKAIGRPPVIALGFEASPEIFADITRMLDLRDPLVTFADILRPNIQYEVLRTVNAQEKRRTIEQTLREVAGPGIVHTGTVTEAKALCEHLTSLGVKATMWHNKMKKAEREEVEETFRSGKARVIVSASGSHMPAERPDIRFVIHATPPSSIETYCLEAGRLSRDGRPGLALLLYDASDQKSQRLAAGSHFPSREEFERVYDALEELSQEEREIPIKDINALSSVSYARTKTIVSILKRAGYLRQAKTSKYTLLQPKKTHDALMEDLRPYQGEEERLRERRQAIIRYTRSTRCRGEYLRQHFGLPSEGPCGICDTCRSAEVSVRAVATTAEPAPAAVSAPVSEETQVPLAEEEALRVTSPAEELPAEAAPVRSRYAVGDVVWHQVWGDGEVLEAHDGKVLVDFPGIGEKKLSDKHLSPGDRSRLPRKTVRATEKTPRAAKSTARRGTKAQAASATRAEPEPVGEPTGDVSTALDETRAPAREATPREAVEAKESDEGAAVSQGEVPAVSKDEAAEERMQSEGAPEQASPVTGEDAEQVAPDQTSPEQPPSEEARESEEKPELLETASAPRGTSGENADTNALETESTRADVEEFPGERAGEQAPELLEDASEPRRAEGTRGDAIETPGRDTGEIL